MKSLEKILVATDFGPSAGDALRTAQVLATTWGSKVILLHVMPNLPGSLVGLRPLRLAIRERLWVLQNELVKAGVSVVASEVAEGVAFDQILRASDRLDVNVIVVGSGGQAESGAGPLGVTTERLVRKASQPVWVVKAGAAPVFQRILCAVDFSDPARRALGNAIHLARSFRAELQVLHVSESWPELYAVHAAVAVEAQARYQSEERQELDAFLRAFDFSAVAWTKVERQGVAHREILRCAGEWKADLLVMGSVGRTGLSRILLGSVAGKVLREMPCSVITVKPEGAVPRGENIQ